MKVETEWIISTLDLAQLHLKEGGVDAFGGSHKLAIAAALVSIAETLSDLLALEEGR